MYVSTCAVLPDGMSTQKPEVLAQYESEVPPPPPISKSDDEFLEEGLEFLVVLSVPE